MSVHYYTFYSKDKPTIVKSEKKLNKKDQKLIKSGLLKSGDTPKQIQFEKIEGSNLFYIVQNSSKVIENIEVKDDLSLRDFRHFELKPTPKKNFWQSLLKMPKWSHYIPIIGWSIGIAAHLHRRKQFRELEELEVSAEHLFGEGAAQTKEDFIRAHAVIARQIKKDMADVESPEIRSKMEETVNALNTSRKLGHAMIKCKDDPKKYDKLAKNIAKQVENEKLPLLVPCYYYDIDGQVHNYLLNIYKEDNEIVIQRIEYRVEDNETDCQEFAIGEDSSVEELLKELFRYQIPPKVFEEIEDDSTIGRLKKMGESMLKEGVATTKTPLLEDPRLAIQKTFETNDFSLDRKEDLSHARKERVSKPVELYLKAMYGEGDEFSFDKLTRLRWQLELVTDISSILAETKTGSITERRKRLIALQDWMTELSQRMGKEGLEDTWDFLLEDRRKEINALIEECNVLIAKEETKLSKNRSKLITSIAKKSKPQAIRIPSTPPAEAAALQTSLEQDKLLDEIQKIKVDPAIPQSLSENFTYEYRIIGAIRSMMRYSGRESSTVEELKEFLASGEFEDAFKNAVRKDSRYEEQREFSTVEELMEFLASGEFEAAFKDAVRKDSRYEEQREFSTVEKLMEFLASGEFEAAFKDAVRKDSRYEEQREFSTVEKLKEFLTSGEFEPAFKDAVIKDSRYEEQREFSTVEELKEFLTSGEFEAAFKDAVRTDSRYEEQNDVAKKAIEEVANTNWEPIKKALDPLSCTYLFIPNRSLDIEGYALITDQLHNIPPEIAGRSIDLDGLLRFINKNPSRRRDDVRDDYLNSIDVETPLEAYKTALKDVKRILAQERPEDPVLYRQRLKALEEQIQKIMLDLPVPIGPTSHTHTNHSVDYWNLLTIDQMEEWSSTLTEMMETLAETHTRLGASTLDSRTFLAVTSANAVSTHLLKLNASKAREQLADRLQGLSREEKDELNQWAKDLGIDFDPGLDRYLHYDQIGSLLATDLPDRVALSHMGFVCKQLGEEDLLYRALLHNYTAHRDPFMKYGFNHPKVDGLNPMEKQKFQQLQRYYEDQWRGGFSTAHITYKPNLQFYPISAGEEHFKFKLIFITLGARVDEKHRFRSNKKEIYQEFNRNGILGVAFGKDVMGIEPPISIPILQSTMKQSLYTEILLDANRLNSNPKLESMDMKTMLKVASMAESAEDLTQEEIEKLLQKENNRQKMLDKMGPWKLVYDEDQKKLTITDTKERSRLYFSDRPTTFGEKLNKQNLQDPAFLASPKSAAFERIHRIKVFTEPVSTKGIIAGYTIDHVNLEKDRGWEVANTKYLDDLQDRGPLGTGLTKAQEKALASLEIAEEYPGGKKGRAFSKQHELIYRSVSPGTVDNVMLYVFTYPDTLSNPGVQQCLYKALDHPFLLQRAMTAEPEKFAEWAKEIRFLMDTAIENKETEKALFLISLANRIESQALQQKKFLAVPYTHPEAYTELDTPFPLNIKETNTLISVTEKRKKAIADTLSFLKNEGVVDFLINQYEDEENLQRKKDIGIRILEEYAKILPELYDDEDWNRLYAINFMLKNQPGIVTNPQIKDLALAWFESVAAPFFIQKGDKDLSSLVKVLLGKEEIFEGGFWEEFSSGIAELRDSKGVLKYSIDLKTGIVYDEKGKSNAVSQLPKAVFDHPDFMKVFGPNFPKNTSAQISQGKQPGTYTFEFEHNKHSFQIHFNERTDEIYILQRLQLAENAWAVYEHPPKMKKTALANLMNEQGFWRLQDDPKTAFVLLHDQGTPNPEETLKLSFKDLPTPSIFSYEYWKGGGKKEQSAFILGSVTNVGSKKELMNVSPSDLQDIFGFTTPKDALFFGKKGKVDEILFRDMQIKLEYKNKKWVVNDLRKGGDLNGYVLQEDCTGLMMIFGVDYKNLFLPLIHPKKRDRRLIMRPMQAKLDPTIRKHAQLLVDPEIDPKLSSIFMDVSISPSEATTAFTHSYMNLAYLMAQKKQYDKAMLYLRRATTAAAPHSHKEKEEALKVLQFLKSQIDQEPMRSREAEFFHLHFSLAYRGILRDQFDLSRYHLDSPDKEVEEITSIVNLYDKVKGLTAPSVFLQFTKVDGEQFELFKREALTHLFEMEETAPPEEIKEEIEIDLPDPLANTLAFVKNIVEFGEKPNPKISFDDVPKYLTKSEFFRLYPSLFEIAKEIEDEDLIRKLFSRCVIHEKNSVDRQAINLGISMLYGAVMSKDSMSPEDFLKFNDLSYPKTAKMTGDITLRKGYRLGKGQEAFEKLTEQLEPFLKFFPEKEKRVLSKEEPKQTVSIESIRTKVEESDYSPAEKERWLIALKSIDLERTEEGLTRAELIEKLLEKGVSFKSEVYQPRPAKIERYRSTQETKKLKEVKKEAPKQLEEWKAVKERAFNTLFPFRPSQEAIDAFNWEKDYEGLYGPLEECKQEILRSKGKKQVNAYAAFLKKVATEMNKTLPHPEDRTPDNIEDLEKFIIGFQKLQSHQECDAMLQAMKLGQSLDDNLTNMITESNRKTTKAIEAQRDRMIRDIEAKEALSFTELKGLYEFIQISKKRSDLDLLAARKELVKVAEDFAYSGERVPDEVARFFAMVRSKEQFSNPEIIRKAKDLYVLGFFEKEPLNRIGVEVEQLLLFNKQINGLVAAEEKILTMDRMLGKLSKMKHPSSEDFAAFEREWNIQSKAVYQLLEQSQTVEGHREIEDSSLRRLVLRYETRKGFNLRPEQIEKLIDVINNPEGLQLFDTGAGKTSVIFPLAIEILLQQGRFPFQLVTDKLYHQFVSELDPQSRELFQKGAYEFQWDASTIVYPNGSNDFEVIDNITKLQDMWEKLEEAKTKHNRYPVLRLRTQASLKHDLTMIPIKLEELQKEMKVYEEAVKGKGKERADEPLPIPTDEEYLALKFQRDLLLQEYHWTKKIWQAFHDKEVVYLADEPDAIFPPNKEINRAFGQLIELESYRYLTPYMLLAQLFENPQSDAIEKLKEKLIAGEQKTLTEIERKEAIRDIARVIFTAQQEFLGDEFNAIDEDEFINFMTGVPGSHIPEGFPRHKDRAGFERVATLKEWLSRTLDISLQKKPGYDYGPSLRDNATMVVYEEGEAPANPRVFSSDLLAITNNFFYYLANDFTPEYIERYPNLEGKDTIERLHHLGDGTKFFGQIKVHEKSLKCNSQHAVLNTQIRGASATGESYAFPFKASDANPKELLVKVISTVAKQEGGKGLEAQIEEFDELKETEKDIYDSEVVGLLYQCGFDIGETNNTIAGRILSIEGKGPIHLHYIDKVTRNKKTESSDEANNLSPHKFLFGPKDVRGTDFKMPSGKFVIILGPDVTEEEMLQTIGRLRQFGRGQDAVFKLHKPVADRIRATLKMADGEPITNKDLFKYVELITLRENAKKNLKAKMLRIDGKLVAAFEKVAFVPNEKSPKDWSDKDYAQEAEKADRALHFARDYGIGYTEFQTKVLYLPEKEVVGVEDKIHDSVVSKLKVLNHFKDQLPREDQPLVDTVSLFAEFSGDIDTANLPNKVRPADLSDADTEAEVEVQVEVEQEVEQEVTEEVEREVGIPMEDLPELEDKKTHFDPDTIDQFVETGVFPDKPATSTGITPTIGGAVIPFTKIGGKTTISQACDRPSLSRELRILDEEKFKETASSFNLDPNNHKKKGEETVLWVVLKHPEKGLRWLKISQTDYAQRFNPYIQKANYGDKDDLNYVHINHELQMAVFAIPSNGKPRTMAKSFNFDTEGISEEGSLDEDLVRIKLFEGHLNFPEEEKGMLKAIISEQRTTKAWKEKLTSLHGLGFMTDIATLPFWKESTVGQVIEEIEEEEGF